MKIKIKDKKKAIKKIIFIPDAKIKIDQLKKTKSVCPISGCIANSKAMQNVIKKEIKYLTRILEYFWLHKIVLINIIKKGFTNSIGWNLGKKFRSIHLLDPLTSTPMNGTKIKNNSDNKKISKEILKSFSFFKDER